MTFSVILGTSLTIPVKSLFGAQTPDGGTYYPSTTCRHLILRDKNTFIILSHFLRPPRSTFYWVRGDIDFYLVSPVTYSFSTWKSCPGKFVELIWPGFPCMCQPYFKWRVSTILQIGHKVHAEGHNSYHMFKNLRHTQHEHAVDWKKMQTNPIAFWEYKNSVYRLHRYKPHL